MEHAILQHTGPMALCEVWYQNWTKTIISGSDCSVWQGWDRNRTPGTFTRQRPCQSSDSNKQQARAFFHPRSACVTGWYLKKVQWNVHKVLLWLVLLWHYQLSSFMWSIYPYPSGSLHWVWDSNVTTKHSKVQTVCIFLGMYCILHVFQGLYSLSRKTSYRQISWSLKVARFFVIMIVSFWNLTSTSAALLPRCLSNFRAIVKV